MSQKSKSWTPGKLCAVIFLSVQLLSTALLLYILLRFPILPSRYFIAVGASALALFFLDIFLFTRKKNKVCYITGCFLTILVSCVAFTGYVYLEKTRSTLDKITNEPADKLVLEEDMVVIVRKDDPAQDTKDTLTYPYGIQNMVEFEKSLSAVEFLNHHYNTELHVIVYNSYSELASALLDGTVNAILINSSYVDIVGEYEEGFMEKIRVLEQLSFEQTVPKLTITPTPTITPLPEPTQAPNTTPTPTPTPILGPTQAVPMPPRESKTDITKNYFTVYFSGIDTYGSITRRSRSDVNIVMTVNPQTKKILLVTIPRDAYVTIPGVSGGNYDKLTHAGLYGVGASIRTLQNVYGIEIDYYVRVNFSSVEKFVDLLGGIDVYSAFDFVVQNTHYVKGINHLNGVEALRFARERHSFAAGDNQRGKNQMEVIKAVIQKMSSPAMLTRFSDIMNAVSGNFQTDLTMDQLTSLVRMQLDDGASWNIESYAVKTTGGYEYCYSYHGRKLYVGYINWDSASEAGRKMRAVMEGK